MDLFNRMVSEEKLHPNFVHTAGPHAAGIRQVLNDWASGFIKVLPVVRTNMLN